MRANLRRGQLLDPRAGSRLQLFEIEENESRGVPDLVGEGAIAEDALFAQRNVGAGRGHHRQREAQRVGAVFLDQLQRVHDVAARLGHLHAFGIAHQRVQVERAEGNAIVGRAAPVLHQVQAHHDHARVPEKQDVVAADQQAGGIEIAQVLRCRPASPASKTATGRS